MPFKKGNKEGKGPVKKRPNAPITATQCKTHYEQLCNRAALNDPEAFDSKDLLTLFKFEYEQLYGKAKESAEVKVEHSGELNHKAMPMIRELTANEWLMQFAPQGQPTH